MKHIICEHLVLADGIDFRQTIVDIVLLQLMFDIDFKFKDNECQENLVFEIKTYLANILKDSYTGNECKVETTEYTNLAIQVLRSKSFKELTVVVKNNPIVVNIIKMRIQDYSSVSQELFERII